MSAHITNFKFQSDSINTVGSEGGIEVHTALNSNLILLILSEPMMFWGMWSL